MDKNNLSRDILSSIVAYMKYGRYIPQITRRETWDETVTRNEYMHLKKYPALTDEIKAAYKYVQERKVLPSMRSMQFAGKAIEINNARLYNCSYVAMDSIEAFSEIMFLLLSGCFHSDTLVKTTNGDKKFSELTTEDFVYTYDEDSENYTTVNPVWVGRTQSENKQKIRLELEDGSCIDCTHDHLFLTSNRGWVKAGDLEESDDLQSMTAPSFMEGS